METVIAKRSPAGLLFLVGVATSLEITINGIIARSFLMAFFGVLLTVAFLPYTIHFIRLPANVISLSERNTLLLPGNKEISLFSIENVSYKRAMRKNKSYRWGTVTITTRSNTYKYHFIADCEEVSKRLIKLTYDGKKKEKRKNKQ